MVKKTLTVREAAGEIGISERALWQRIYRNEFPHRRWSKKVMIIRADLDEFLRTLPGLTVQEAAAKVGEHVA